MVGVVPPAPGSLPAAGSRYTSACTTARSGRAAASAVTMSSTGPHTAVWQYSGVLIIRADGLPGSQDVGQAPGVQGTVRVPGADRRDPPGVVHGRGVDGNHRLSGLHQRHLTGFLHLEVLGGLLAVDRGGETPDARLVERREQGVVADRGALRVALEAELAPVHALTAQSCGERRRAVERRWSLGAGDGEHGPLGCLGHQVVALVVEQPDELPSPGGEPERRCAVVGARRSTAGCEQGRRAQRQDARTSEQHAARQERATSHGSRRRGGHRRRAGRSGVERHAGANLSCRR